MPPRVLKSSVKRRPSARSSAAVEEQAPRILPPAPQGPAADVVHPTTRELGECPVDGIIVHVGNHQAGKWYLFTQVSEDIPRPGRKTPEEVGREGLYNAIVDTYHHVFPPGHLCHTGPEFGKVVQEGHPNSTVAALKNLHNHAACQFPEEHRWKSVEKYLREQHGIKVHISKADFIAF